MSLDICVWDKCNNRCRMCTNPIERWPSWDGSYDYSIDAITKRIDNKKEEFLKMDSIYLSGGEPTMNPSFLDLLKYLKNNFPDQRVKLLTNGRRFSYDDFAKKTLAINNNFEIDLSIYGPTEEVHDKITQTKNSFNQTTLGLENLLNYKKKGQIVGVRTVITGLSYKYIEQMLELIAVRFPTVDRVVIIFWEPEAQAIINQSEVEVKYDAVKTYLEKLSVNFLEQFRDVRFYHFPLCRLPMKLWPYMWRTLPKEEIEFVKECDDCNYKKYCLGIHKGYLENVEDNGFKAIKNDIKIIDSGFQYRPIRGIK